MSIERSHISAVSVLAWAATEKWIEDGIPVIVAENDDKNAYGSSQGHVMACVLPIC